MGIVYLDSSVALRTILDVPERVALQKWMQTPGTVHVSSRLLRTEVVRVLHHHARPLTDGTPLLDRVDMLDITRETHTVAESITIDAERQGRSPTGLTLRTVSLVVVADLGLAGSVGVGRPPLRL